MTTFSTKRNIALSFIWNIAIKKDKLNVNLTFSRTGPISHDLKLIAAFLMKTCVVFHGTYSQSEQQPSFRGIPDDYFKNQSWSY